MKSRKWNTKIKYSSCFLAVSLFVLGSITGCTSTEQVFVATADSPSTPTLAVIPANNGLYQHHFANDVEEKVIEAGLNVIGRPSVTMQEISQEAELAQMAGDKQASQQTAEITQTYSGFEESDADYVIQTYASSDQVRVLEQSSGKVLASFDMSQQQSGPTQVGERENPLRRALREIGLPVKQTEEE